MTVKKKVIRKKSSSGTNVRFNEAAFKVIKKHCDTKGYKIGAFCTNAAMDKVILESSKKAMI